MVSRFMQHLVRCIVGSAFALLLSSKPVGGKAGYTRRARIQRDYMTGNGYGRRRVQATDTATADPSLIATVTLVPVVSGIEPGASPPSPACQIELDLTNCTIVPNDYALGSGNTSEVGYPCSRRYQPPALVACDKTPHEAYMLYNGGNCSQSDYYPGNFSCNDGCAGSPPTQDGNVSYIIVNDASNKGIVYFQGWVAVGVQYMIDATDPGEIGYGFHIQIYSTDPTGQCAKRLLQQEVV